MFISWHQRKSQSWQVSCGLFVPDYKCISTSASSCCVCLPFLLQNFGAHHTQSTLDVLRSVGVVGARVFSDPRQKSGVFVGPIWGNQVMGTVQRERGQFGRSNVTHWSLLSRSGMDVSLWASTIAIRIEKSQHSRNSDSRQPVWLQTIRQAVQLHKHTSTGPQLQKVRVCDVHKQRKVCVLSKQGQGNLNRWTSNLTRTLQVQPPEKLSADIWSDLCAVKVLLMFRLMLEQGNKVDNLHPTLLLFTSYDTNYYSLPFDVPWISRYRPYLSEFRRPTSLLTEVASSQRAKRTWLRQIWRQFFISGGGGRSEGLSREWTLSFECCLSPGLSSWSVTPPCKYR